MRAVSAAIVLLCLSSVGLSAQSNLQKFRYWGTLSKDDKLTFFLGFTNGLGASRVTIAECEKITCATMTPLKREQVRCLFSGKLDVDQAVAMIDKYYKENPEKWNTPIGLAMLDALTVNGGPCGEAEAKK
jgi:hypothetical protein